MRVLLLVGDQRSELEWWMVINSYVVGLPESILVLYLQRHLSYGWY